MHVSPPLLITRVREQDAPEGRLVVLVPGEPEPGVVAAEEVGVIHQGRRVGGHGGQAVLGGGREGIGGPTDMGTLIKGT